MVDHIFREYDIRGKVGTELLIEDVYRFGLALAAFFKQQSIPIKTIALGMDGRLHSAAIKEQLTAALIDAGYSVLFLGTCPTPVMYFSQYMLPVQAGVMITASHNPSEYNGFKICIHRESVWGAQLQQIKELYKRMNKNSARMARQVHHERNSYTEIDGITQYVDYLASLFPHLRNKKIPAIVDCANAVGGLVFPRLIEAFGWRGMKLIFAELDGTYPNHEADPVVAENMQTLKELLTGNDDYAFGIGLDGDADRMAPMTKSGRLILGDQLVALFSKGIQGKPNAAVVVDVRSSATMIEYVRKLGMQVHISPCGHSIIKHEMQQHHALLGGELSCHFFFKDRYFGYDDGIYAALRLFELLVDSQETNASLDAFVDALPPSYPSPELRIPCVEQEKKVVVERVKTFFAARRDAQTMTIDGVRAILPYGWGLIRPSNTQSVLSLRFESTTPQGLQRIKNDFICALRDTCDASILDKIAHG